MTTKPAPRLEGFIKLMEENLKGNLRKDKHLRLLIQHAKFLLSESEATQKLFIQIIGLGSLIEAAAAIDREHDYSGAFKDTVMNSLKYKEKEFWGDIFWDEVKNHNIGVMADFAIRNIDFPKWFYPKFSPAVSVDVPLEYNTGEAVQEWNQLIEALNDFEHCFKKTILFNSIRKDIIRIKKMKKKIINGNFDLNKATYEQEWFPTYQKSLKHLEKNKAKTLLSFAKNFKFGLIYSDLLAFKEISKITNFIVKFWERDPLSDIYQGNYSNCCLAIGEKDTFPAVHLPGVACATYPAGILEYLIDSGIQVVEIIVEREKNGKKYSNTIGQAWVLIADYDKKPTMVVDSVDMLPFYGFEVRRRMNMLIRKALFDFLRRVAKNIGIKQILLGKIGPTVTSSSLAREKHVIQNDIRVKDLPIVTVPLIEKIGGYFKNNQYFLESVGGTEAYKIL